MQQGVPPMTLEDVLGKIRDRGLTPVRVLDAPPSEKQPSLIFAGDLDELVETAKSLASNAVFVLALALGEHDFTHESDEAALLAEGGDTDDEGEPEEQDPIDLV